MTHPTPGAVAGGNPLTVEAGLRALRLGGNAADAAVAAQLMACVSEPLLTGLGGGGLAIVRTPDGIEVLDAFSDKPGREHAGPWPRMERVDLDFGPTTQTFLVGAASVAVPGLARGLWALHARHGRLPLPLLAEPAVRAAREGVAVSEGLARSIALLWPVLLRCPWMRAAFGHRGGPAGPGHRYRMPALARTIERLASEGPDWLHEGEGAEALLRALGGGSAMSALDLAAWRPRTRAPLERLHGPARVAVPPPPSLAGLLVLRALHAWEAEGCLAPHGSAVQVLALARSLQAAARARGDGAFRRRVASRAAAEAFARGESGFTTHLGAVDGAGMAVGITSSLGETAGITVPETGVVLNNFLGEEDVDPPDAPVAAGSRLATMCCPTIVELPDGLAVMGTGGSRRIPSTIFQGVVALVDADLDLQEAVGAPRCHVEEGILRVEVFGRREPGFLDALRAAWGPVVAFEEVTLYFGGLHVASVRGHRFLAAGDPRRSGTGEVVEPPLLPSGQR